MSTFGSFCDDLRMSTFGPFCDDCTVLHWIQPSLQYQKSPKRMPNCLKIAETSVILIVLNGVLCDVSVYTVTSFIRTMTK